VWRSWNRLALKDRPAFPGTLLRILSDLYNYPFPDFVCQEAEIEQTIILFDKSLDALLRQAAKIASITPPSQHYDSLTALIEGRFASQSEGGQFAQVLATAIQQLCDTPPLVARPSQLALGRPKNSPSLRAWVELICWYVLTVEKRKVTGSEVDGVPTGRVSRLIRATMAGAGVDIPDRALITEIKHAKARSSALCAISFWDLMPTYPAIHRSGQGSSFYRHWMSEKDNDKTEQVNPREF
jgi:hypothetical protein